MSHVSLKNLHGKNNSTLMTCLPMLKPRAVAGRHGKQGLTRIFSAIFILLQLYHLDWVFLI